MGRRNFLQKIAISSAAISLLGPLVYATEDNKIERNKFNFKYAPHIGMFKNSAGADPLAQIDFMPEQGFTAPEDNRMMRRSVNEKARIGFLIT